MLTVGEINGRRERLMSGEHGWTFKELEKNCPPLAKASVSIKVLIWRITAALNKKIEQSI